MRISYLLICLGVFALFTGHNERTLSLGTAEEPQEITAKQLAENGPGDNAHVLLTRFKVSEKEFVYVGREDKWKRVYLPLQAQSGRYRKKIGILLKSSKIKNMAELEELDTTRRVQGTVINEIESLGSEERKLLEESYPKVDFSEVWVLEHGRRPPSGQKILLFFVGWFLLLGLGIWQFRAERQ